MRDRVMVYNITSEGREVLSEVYLLKDFSLEDIIDGYDDIGAKYSKEWFLNGTINQAVFREGERAYRLYVVNLEQATKIIDNNRQRELDVVLKGGLKREEVHNVDSYISVTTVNEVPSTKDKLNDYRTENRPNINQEFLIRLRGDKQKKQ